MKSMFRHASIQFLSIVILVAAVAVAANIVATSSTSNDLPLGKNMNLLKPMPDVPKGAGQQAVKPLTYPSLQTGSEPAHGIVNNNASPFQADEYLIENEWQEIVAGQWVQIYAGSLPDDPTQGVVIVRVSPLDWSQTTTVGVYKVRGGTLRIVSAANRILVLHSSSGAHFRFDAVGWKFLS
jgi:hypothetical protein